MSDATLVMRGDEVSFVRADDKEIVKLPKEWQLVHDSSGKYLRNCDIFVLSPSKSDTPLSKTDKGVLNSAKEHYGKSTRLHAGSVDIPEGPWHRLAKVTHIRYKRLGAKRGRYQHSYKFPVWLYYCEDPLAWKIALPDGCVVNHRGFVFP
jgi:hypothetical protein